MKALVFVITFLLLTSITTATFSTDKFRTSGPPTEGAKQIIKRFSPVNQQYSYVKKYYVPETLFGLKITRINGKKVYFRELKINKIPYKPYEKVPLRKGSNSIYANK